MLHKQLLQLMDEDFKPAAPSPSPMARKRCRNTSHTHKQLDDWVLVSGVQKRRQRCRNTSHTHKQLDDWVLVSGVQKRRQRACKVCPLY
ncbi:hypothetical protein PC129_g17052 [Phytophthora cactorum]|uniref:Uncharacterized protein n=1 Tax=Phytophthora cactorum TaxID=29920 RepID=A0A329RE03_9STRA|nr:hypothetical protein Pcac1_g25473 [Phytophthora cactorum]KAG2803190.1 hypothetical protein PC112_g19288 [Phytophthora cactorum]KAG2804949.1 hypothetical protein PC111_g18039 [Phytophthora cactorum]KAG2842440.1 hypothetical protein PC113_g18801 [Phytophthora cactorum]KAG2883817.1 hypothetical protein PC114_g20405 [Phytophthora cactorum]